MTTQENVNFIGKGKQFGNKIQISFNWKDLLKLKKTQFKCNKYLVLDVLPLKKEGKFNQTHTIVEHVPIVKES